MSSDKQDIELIYSQIEQKCQTEYKQKLGDCEDLDSNRDAKECMQMFREIQKCIKQSLVKDDRKQKSWFSFM